MDFSCLQSGPASVDPSFSAASPSFGKPTKSDAEMKESVKGSTTLAFVFSDGVVVAVDVHPAAQSVNRIIEINPYMLGTVGGSVADYQVWLRYLAAQCRLYELANKRKMSVASASKLLANELYAKGHTSCSFMIAGWDKEVPTLYFVNSTGVRIKGDRFCVGSGAPYASEFLDDGFCENMTVLEAAELARHAIYDAMVRDGATAGGVSVYHVAPNGWMKVISTNVEDLHYESGATAKDQTTEDGQTGAKGGQEVDEKNCVEKMSRMDLSIDGN